MRRKSKKNPDLVRKVISGVQPSAGGEGSVAGSVLLSSAESEGSVVGSVSLSSAECRESVTVSVALSSTDMEVDVEIPSKALVKTMEMLTKLKSDLAHLTDSQREDVVQLIESYKAFSSDVPSQTNVLKHNIDVSSSTRIVLTRINVIDLNERLSIC